VRKRKGLSLRRLVVSDRGQVLAISGLMLLVLLGMSALAVDGGRAMFTSRELQATTDAAALAGARVLPTATTWADVVTAATSYSAVSGDENARTNLPSVTVAVNHECYQTLENAGGGCAGPVPYNAVQVTQTSVLPMYFAGLFGHKTVTLSATSTAEPRGLTPRNVNVAIIVDATLSMNSEDSNCGNITQMQCALNGVQVLLNSLSPCPAAQKTCTITNGVAANSVQRVSLFTFPNVSTATAALDTTCTTTVPTPTTGSKGNGYWNSLSQGFTTNFNFVMPILPNGVTLPSTITPWGGLPTGMAYSFPSAGASTYIPAQSDTMGKPQTVGTATYQITPFLSDYRLSDTATSLNTASTLVTAAGGKSGCGGMAPPNFDGNIGTYYAGVLYAAQSALVAEQKANSGSQNIMIILSDGDATAPQISNNFNVMPSPATGNGLYPSFNDECTQAVTAAQYATSQGTTVYSVAYGSGQTGCKSDGGSISPCDTMAQMASTTHYFYSDYQQSGSNSNCVAGQPVTALKDIFTSIATELTTARLLPNNLH
jgi:Flp pilus assembly protein TadG